MPVVRYGRIAGKKVPVLHFRNKADFVNYAKRTGLTIARTIGRTSQGTLLGAGLGAAIAIGAAPIIPPGIIWVATPQTAAFLASGAIGGGIAGLGGSYFRERRLLRDEVFNKKLMARKVKLHERRLWVRKLRENDPHTHALLKKSSRHL